MNSASLSMPRLAVLVSGNGSNLQAILDACASSRLPAKVILVIADQPHAYGLERASRAGVPAVCQPKTREEPRPVYDAKLASLASLFRADWVILAGWMRILSANFLNAFPGRVINLHPALPGAFPGTHAIERAFEAYQRQEIQHTGVMVHLVPDEGVDSGPVLNQAIVPILPEDTLDTLEARVHETEHTILIQTLERVLHASHSDLLTDKR